LYHDLLAESLLRIEQTPQTALDTFHLTTTIPSTYHHNHADINL